VDNVVGILRLSLRNFDSQLAVVVSAIVNFREVVLHSVFLFPVSTSSEVICWERGEYGTYPLKMFSSEVEL
jgi:hypothetical protein